MKQSYCCTHWFNYGKKIVFGPVRSQLQFFLGFNLSFTRSLDAPYLKKDG